MYELIRICILTHVLKCTVNCDNIMCSYQCRVVRSTWDFSSDLLMDLVISVPICWQVQRGHTWVYQLECIGQGQSNASRISCTQLPFPHLLYSIHCMVSILAVWKDIIGEFVFNLCILGLHAIYCLFFCKVGDKCHDFLYCFIRCHIARKSFCVSMYACC